MACTAKATTILFLAFLIYCHAVTDRPGACKSSGITVSTTPTGKVVWGQPEHRVTIDNKCGCAQAGVTVHCAGGVPSVEPVDESKIRVQDSVTCLVNDEMPIASGSPVVFTYAWKMPQVFSPIVLAVPHC